MWLQPRKLLAYISFDFWQDKIRWYICKWFALGARWEKCRCCINWFAQHPVYTDSTNCIINPDNPATQFNLWLCGFRYFVINWFDWHVLSAGNSSKGPFPYNRHFVPVLPILHPSVAATLCLYLCVHYYTIIPSLRHSINYICRSQSFRRKSTVNARGVSWIRIVGAPEHLSAELRHI